MTEAARLRRTARHNLQPVLVEYLETRSMMRFRSSPARIKSAARVIARTIVAAHRRAAGTFTGSVLTKETPAEA